MEDCIFCKIISGEIPAERVYEDDKVLAFLDLKPSSKGHTLIVHKTHSQDFLSTPAEALSDLMPRIQKVATGVLKTTGASGFNLTVNNGSAAGQVVFHLHFHMIPRYQGDGLKLFTHHESERTSRQQLADQIKQNIQ